MTYTWKDLRNFETVLVGERGELWRWFNREDGETQFKVCSDDRGLMRQIAGWEGAKRGASYYRQDGVMFTFDVVIPRRLVRRACKVLGVDFRKDPDRQEKTALALTNLRPFLKRHCQKTTGVGGASR